MRPTADRFLEAFVEIEAYLRRRLDGHSFVSFRALVTEAAEDLVEVKQHQSFLLAAASLRNSIVHTPQREGRVIADPRESAVEQLERLRDLLLSPPLLFPSFCQDHVAMCEVDDPIAVPLDTMYEKSFSQVPVYEGGRFQALLTADTIARWLSRDRDTSMLSTTPVATVLQHAEFSDNYAFLSKKATVYDALSVFDRFAHLGSYLDAVLITREGDRDVTPEGILTVFDLRALYAAVELGEL